MKELTKYIKEKTGEDIEQPLKELFNRGMVSHTSERHAEIYNYYSSIRHRFGDGAIQQTCDKFSISKQTLYNIIRALK
jgi:hypothetical protein